MKHLNSNQREYLRREFNLLSNQREAHLKKITEAVKPGELAYQLSWVAEATIITDYETEMLDEFRRACEYEERPHPATPEEFIRHYEKQMVEWMPKRSTSAMSNLCEEAKRTAMRMTLKRFEVLAVLGSEGEEE